MNELDLLMLDYDDTLAPTEEIAILADYRLALKNQLFNESDLGYEDYFNRYAGLTYSQIIKYFIPDLSSSELERFVAEEVDVINKVLGDNVVATTGANQTLEKLDREFSQLQKIVVSSSVFSRLLVCLKQAEQLKFFRSEKQQLEGDTVFSAQTTMNLSDPKPSPAIYNYALKTRGVSSDRAAGVEDSVSGMQSLCAANVKYKIGFIGAKQAKKYKEEKNKLYSAGADLVCEHWDQIPEIIKEIELGRFDLCCKKYQI